MDILAEILWRVALPAILTVVSIPIVHVWFPIMLGTWITVFIIWLITVNGGWLFIDDGDFNFFD